VVWDVRSDVAEVLSLIVDGRVVRAAFVIAYGDIIAYWPIESMDHEAIKISKFYGIPDAHDLVYLIYGETFYFLYAGVVIRNTVLILRISKAILKSGISIILLLRTLSRFAKKVNALMRVRQSVHN